MLVFVNCFTAPGFEHFQSFIIAHAALLGLNHCITEVMRLTGLHYRLHWTTPYAFMKKGRWSCREVSQCLLDLITSRLKIMEEIIIAIDDTLVKKTGKKFYGLGHYPDPTDKNPGASKRRVLGHSWVVMALLWEKSGRWFAFPIGTLLFVPEAVCSKVFQFRTKIELAVMMIRRLRWPARRLVLVVDNLYAKSKLAWLKLEDKKIVLVSRLRSNAALYQPPPVPKKRKRGQPRKRGKKVSAKQLWARRSKRKKLKVKTYGKTKTIEAVVGVMIPSRTLGNKPILVIIFPQRNGKKMIILFSTDISMDPVRLIELYAARFKIEELFREIKTVGGFGDYQQRSFKPIKRHATLCLVAYSLLRLLSVTIPNAKRIEAEPWWSPAGPPSTTRLRRAVSAAWRISFSLHFHPKPNENISLKKAA